MAEQFHFDDLDEIVHGRVRLGIMSYLSSAGTAEFNEIKTKLQLTDGNLSVHLRKLEDAGYVLVDKSFVGRKPLTRATLTDAGRTAFVKYLEAISRLVAAAG